MVPHATASKNSWKINAALSTQGHALAFNGEKDFLQEPIFFSFSADLLQNSFTSITHMFSFSSSRSGQYTKIRGNLGHGVLHLP
jgi:hypothetical protein